MKNLRNRGGTKASGTLWKLGAMGCIALMLMGSGPGGLTSSSLRINADNSAGDKLVVNVNGSPVFSVNEDGDVTIEGALSLTGAITGDVSASQITDGTMAFTGDISLTGNITATGFTGNGSGLADVDAALLGGQNLAHVLNRDNHTGTIAVGDITGLGDLATLNSIALTNTTLLTGLLPVSRVDGLGAFATLSILDLDADPSLITGTLADAHLSSNVPLLVGGNLELGSGNLTTTGNVTAANFIGGTGDFDALASTGPVVIGGGASDNFVTIRPELSAIGNFDEGVSTSQEAAGEIGQGLSILASTNHAASIPDNNRMRGISIRGRISDNIVADGLGSRQLHSVVGSVTTAGGTNTTAAGGYFNAKLEDGTAGIDFLTGVGADVSVSGSTLTPFQTIAGGRFSADSRNAGAAGAVGAFGTAINETGTRAGSNTGLFGWAAGVSSNNIGVFGTANATETDIILLAANPNPITAGVYAHNPSDIGYALYTDGVSMFNAGTFADVVGTGGLSVHGAMFPSNFFQAEFTGNNQRAASLYSRAEGNGITSGDEIVGGWFESYSDGDMVVGAFGAAEYKGAGSATGWAIGVDGMAHTTSGGIAAIGTAGSAVATNTSANIGLLGRAELGTQNVGIMGSANATQTQLFTAGAGIDSAGIFAINTESGANDFGLYVNADNNRIVGDLEVTGSVNFSGPVTIQGTSAFRHTITSSIEELTITGNFDPNAVVVATLGNSTANVAVTRAFVNASNDIVIWFTGFVNDGYVNVMVSDPVSP